MRLSSGEAATHWQNNYISVDLSSSTIPRNGGTITATIKGLKETGNAQTFSIYRAGRTTKYLDITVTKVEKGTEEINCGDVFISHGQTLILTNDQNEAILWGKVKEDSSSSSNKDIATLVSSNDTVNTYAAVTNPVRDGTAKLVVAIEGTNYNFTVHAMTVEIEKTVKAAYETDKNNRSNATIRVTTHVLYGVHEIPTNTILFIGSTCASHGLGGSNKDTTTARNNTLGQINTIATKGRVKWYLYGNQSGQQATTTAKHSGTLDMEKELTSTDVPVTNYGTGRHRNLLAYLTCLDNELKDDHSGVDYIVLSFDGGRRRELLRGDELRVDPDQAASGHADGGERILAVRRLRAQDKRVLGGSGLEFCGGRGPEVRQVHGDDLGERHHELRRGRERDRQGRP